MTAEPDEYMCPNCVTPWKCNGPHIPDRTAVPAAEDTAKHVARTAKWLREWSDSDIRHHGPREAMAMNMEATLGYIAARKLESLAADNAKLESGLQQLRREYFVAGGEMTTIEACTLIDKLVSK